MIIFLKKITIIARKLGAIIAQYAVLGLVRIFFGFLRLIGLERSSNFGAAFARFVGPMLPTHSIAINNVRAAYPDHNEKWIKEIALGAWENLGRTCAEYAHLDQIFNGDINELFKPSANARVEVVGLEHIISLRDDARPGIIFSAHLANWELPAICASMCGLDTTSVFREPNDPAIARIVHEIRSKTMGNLQAARKGAAFFMSSVLENGGHLGMLIDQHFTRGVPVPFFNRPAFTNLTLGKLARRFDCPVHGVRVIRLPNYRFRIEVTPPIDMPRDSEGKIDPAEAMIAMTAMVENWVREHPEQWLWMHRRWRNPRANTN